VFAILNRLGFANTSSKHRETVEEKLLFLFDDKKGMINNLNDNFWVVLRNEMSDRRSAIRI